jgi:hypothetical protein
MGKNEQANKKTKTNKNCKKRKTPGSGTIEFQS